jgi:hypothetical protein
MFSNLHDRDLNIISDLLNDNNKIIFNTSISNYLKKTSFEIFLTKQLH